ncbi:biotin--[acetyl-CoA-carboxylase] ligase [Weeksellaceae bacterium TAE3-ERU29]|nr:biotin--[acetyl-CoA-carboxylase] ligase [Weeksellaceae bacterium TAE3-ERU29]
MNKLHFVKYIYFSTLPSTNQKLYQLAESIEQAWTVVYCGNQTAGKGYNGSTWQSNDNQNLTFSFLLRELPLECLSSLSMWVARVMYECLTDWQFSVQLKWPNDLILNHKKVGGILIENRIKNNKVDFSVIGIGLNVLQTDFGNLKATSLILNNPDFNISLFDLLEKIINKFQERFYLIEEERYSEIQKLYNEVLFMKNKVASYEWNGKIHNGILKGVNEKGNAIIEIENMGELESAHKEIFLKY